MKRHGVTIDCSRCRFVGSRDHEGFDVVVPVADEGSGLTGHARLHCRVSSQTHVVEFVEWQDREAPVVSAGSALDRRLTGALQFVAEKQLCGNRSLCPSQVVDVVEKAGQPK
jgi:hypothetical protein